MTHRSRVTALAIMAACVAFVGSAHRAAAQDNRPIELGIDAGVTFGLDSPHYTTVSIPTQDFRAGFYFNHMLSLEPSVSFSSISGNGGHLTTYSVGLGAPIHLQQGRPIGTGVYVRPFVGFMGTSITSLGSSNQVQAGAGLGMSLPFATRMASRFEVNYIHGFENNDFDSSNDIGLRVGLSFFTR